MALKKTKKRTRRIWTKEDVRVLKRMARGKTPAKAIGKHLRRSEQAVRQKAMSLGVSLNTRT